MLRHATYDSLLELEDAAAAITSDGAGSGVLDLGAQAMYGTVYIDVSACAVDGGDEAYKISWQLADDTAFSGADLVDAHAITLGDASAIASGADQTIGRFELPVTNVWNGTAKRYARLYVDGTGTSFSITFTAWLGKSQ